MIKTYPITTTNPLLALFYPIKSRSGDPSALARGGMTAARRRRPLYVSIAIGSLNFSTIVLANIGDGSFLRGDRKNAFRLGCFSSSVHPRIVYSCLYVILH